MSFFGEDLSVYFEITCWSSMKRPSAFLWEELLVSYEKTFNKKNFAVLREHFFLWSLAKDLFSRFPMISPFRPLSEEKIFCSGLWWADLLIWSSKKIPSHGLFYEKSFWPSVRSLSDLLRKGLQAFYDKIFWPSMSKSSVFSKSYRPVKKEPSDFLW